MPELPEVETTLRGISPHIIEQTVIETTIRQPRLRWPITPELADKIQGQKLLSTERRAKYLLLHFNSGSILIHLGMSGSLRILTEQQAAEKHDHVDIVFSPRCILRYNDPRRFGCILWLEGDIWKHSLLANLGPEPLDSKFNGEYLFHASRKRKQVVKQWIMNQAVVTGVGNIYANEALFRSGIHPQRQVADISLVQYQSLVSNIQAILGQAIIQGGTTLRNFTNSEGKPGYFKQQLNVYGRAGQPCKQCNTELVEVRINGRTSVFCSTCQPMPGT